MTRRRSKRNLDATDFDSTAFDVDDTDPMASTANLVDAMLVFACGLMMSLIVRYNVDLTKVEDVYVEEDLTKVENIEQMLDDMQSGGSGYTQLGTVYQDPTTGEMYMITESGAQLAENTPIGEEAVAAAKESANTPSRASGAD